MCVCVCVCVCVLVGICSGCIFKYHVIVYTIHSIISSGICFNYFIRECTFSFIHYLNNILLIT